MADQTPPGPPPDARPPARGRRAGVRRPRLRRRQGRSHRRARPRQQGDALLPLHEQGRALPRDPARRLRRRRRRRSTAVRAAGGTPDDQLRALHRRDRAAGAARGRTFRPSGCARWPRAAGTSTRRSSGSCAASSRRSAAFSPTASAPARFAAVNPLVTQMGIVAPLLLFAASAPRPRALSRTRARCRCTTPPRDAIIAHVEATTLAALAAAPLAARDPTRPKETRS